MKRTIAVVVGIALAFSVFANGTKDAPKAAGAAKKSIRLWYYWENELHQKTLDSVVEAFNSSQDALTVKTEYIPFADFKKQLSIGVASEKLPDIVIIDNPDHASYAAMGIFADLTDKLASWPDLAQYYAGPIASCTLNGRLYGIPFGSNCLGLYYRDDLLAAAGVKPPTTWDELKTAAKKTGSGNVMGLGVSAPQNEEGTFQFMPWLWSTGSDSFQIDSAGGKKALALYKDLVESGAMSKEVINWTQGDVMNQFISGNMAMMVNGPWQVPTMRKEAPDLKWNVTLIPRDARNASVLGGENFGVIKNGNVDLSLQFLKFAVNAERVASYIDSFGYIAARKDVAEKQFSGDPVMKKFAEGMQYARPRGPHQRWPEISDAISQAFTKVLIGASGVDAAAKEAQTAIDAIVKAK